MKEKEKGVLRKKEDIGRLGMESVRERDRGCGLNEMDRQREERGK